MSVFKKYMRVLDSCETIDHWYLFKAWFELTSDGRISFEHSMRIRAKMFDKFVKLAFFGGKL